MLCRIRPDHEQHPLLSYERIGARLRPPEAQRRPALTWLERIKARQWGGKRGQALVEMALVLPILLLILMGTMWYGLLILQSTRFDHAAREGAIAGAMASPGTECSTALTTALAILNAAATTGTTCNIDGELVVVTLSGHLPVPPIVPHNGDFDATESAQLRTEPSPSASP